MEPAEPAEHAGLVSVGLLGFGRVGRAVAELASASMEQLTGAGLPLRFAAALVRDRQKPRQRREIDLVESPARFFEQRLDVVIEVMGGVHPAYDYVRRALESGIPVVTANKSLMAARGEELRDLSRRAGVPLAFDAAVLAGVPFVGALARRPFIGAPRRIIGILNGTSHFLACALASGRTFESALAEAVGRGYAEPDSAADVSGRDAAEKLTILAHLAGCCGLRTADITTLGLDALAPVDFAAARALGGVIKPIAAASFDPGCPGAWVGPALVDERHAAASSRGVHNFLEFEHGGHGGHAGAVGADMPVTFAGPGAGPEVTAATILDDVVEVLSGTCTARHVTNHATGRRLDLRQPQAGGWYVRARGAHGSPVWHPSLEDLAEHLAIHRMPAIRIARVQGALVVRTAEATWQSALEAVEALTATGVDALLLPVIEAGANDANDGNNGNEERARQGRDR